MPVSDLKIEDAKRLAKKLGVEGVIILAFEEVTESGPEGEYGGASYGANRAKCQVIGKLMDRMIKNLQIPKHKEDE